MSNKTNEENKEEPQYSITLSSNTKKESSNKLIGNKRIKPDNEEKKENKENKKACNCNKIPSCESLKFDNSTPKQNIIDFFAKKIKDEDFIKSLTESINKTTLNKDRNTNVMCDNCFLNAFISGGLERIFNTQKKESNSNEDISQNEEGKNKLKKIIDLYSTSLNLAISKLKDLKVKYAQTIKSTKDLFDTTALQVMLSNNRDPFQDIKKKMDICLKNLKEIDENFESLINDFSNKEEMKMLYIGGVNNKDNSTNNNLLLFLKSMENEIAGNMNGGLQNSNNKNEKNSENKDISCSNFDLKNINKSNNLLNRVNMKNNISNNQVLNLQNQKKQNEQEAFVGNIDQNELLKNDLFSSLNKNNIIQNGLGILPPFNLSQGRIPSNILINNILNPTNLNHQLFSQIINNKQMSPMLSNNKNLNDNDKNINNLNNILLSGINNPYIQRPNIFSSPIDVTKELQIMAIRNLLNDNSQNNLINNNFNNNQINQINPILSTGPLNDYNPSVPSLYNNFLNLQGKNDISLNNSNIGANEINQLNLINREKMNQSLNNNKQGINMNNMANMTNLNNINLNNMNNINSMSSINNLNSLNGLNALSNNINMNDINNSNLNKEIPNQNFNSFNNINLFQGQLPTNELKGEMILQLFNNVAREREQKNLLHLENNAKTSNLNNNLNEASSIPIEQNYSRQMNSYTSDNKGTPLNIIDNNNISTNEAKVLDNNNNLLLSNNINSKSETNDKINDIEQSKK